MTRTNANILRYIWMNETPDSKKRKIVNSLSEALSVSQQTARLRMTGAINTNDAELLFIVGLLNRSGIDTSKFESEINEIRNKYGEYREYKLQ